ncbi:hypothetical protein E1281_07515 [Actinomadura sp. KC345]|uniref:hypothetical protein n=1 Tax=Actinomadura sp. KC345 TaxID=2530371 RepID=UPI001044F696|nr:hypothetical protein [Actinomadura sp. KC345]TDC56425.1 hypothetical protein E1281_07515 [Actinomadura sp. KC345]
MAAGPRPTPGEAAAALREAEQARAAVSGVRTPLWYFVALGIWVAPVGPLVSLAPDTPAGVAALLGGVAIWCAGLATLLHVVVRRMRVLMWPSGRRTWTLPVVMLVLLGAHAIVQSATDLPWSSEAVTVAVGAAIIVFGVHHRLTGGRSS